MIPRRISIPAFSVLITLVLFITCSSFMADMRSVPGNQSSECFFFQLEQESVGSFFSEYEEGDATLRSQNNSRFSRNPVATYLLSPASVLGEKPLSVKERFIRPRYINHLFLHYLF